MERWKLILAVLISATLLCAAMLFRYSFVSVERTGCVARLDRWTGKITIVNVEGKLIGIFPAEEIK